MQDMTYLVQLLLIIIKIKITHFIFSNTVLVMPLFFFEESVEVFSQQPKNLDHGQITKLHYKNILDAKSEFF